MLKLARCRASFRAQLESCLIEILPNSLLAGCLLSAEDVAVKTQTTGIIDLAVPDVRSATIGVYHVDRSAVGIPADSPAS